MQHRHPIALSKGVRHLAWGISAVALTAATAGCDSGASASPPAATRDPSPKLVHVAQQARKALPAGPVPAGWKVYRSTSVPIVIAYPPHWTVDASNASIGEISFSRIVDTGSLDLTIGMYVKHELPLRLTDLRMRFAVYATRVCETGRTIRTTKGKTISGMKFATAVALCGPEQERPGAKDQQVAYYIGVARKGDVEWTYAFRCNKDDLTTSQRRFFLPMLKTLHIYA